MKLYDRYGTALAAETFRYWQGQSGDCSKFGQAHSSVVIRQSSIKTINKVYKTILLGKGRQQYITVLRFALLF